MPSTTGGLVSAFDYVWERFTGRLDGLTDEEYFWEPAQPAWNLRQAPDGAWQLDGGGGGGPAPDPVPVTTIAWRIGHLGGMAVGGFAERRFARGDVGTAIPFPGDAAGVAEFLRRNYAGWRESLVALDEQGWLAPLGPAWGPYAESNNFDLALHIFDEVVHHAAEVGLLRDLFAHRGALG